MTATLALVFVLGVRHGLVVTALALQAGHLGEAFGLDGLAPYLFLGVAALNLWRLIRPGLVHTHPSPLLALGPFVLGLLLAVGMETSTSSQLAALSLAQSLPPLLLGLTFTLGMVLADGLDGLLAAGLQRGRGADPRRAGIASRAMGWMVVGLSLLFALAGFTGTDLGELAGSLGLVVFGALLALRVWSRLGPGKGQPA